MEVEDLNRLIDVLDKIKEHIPERFRWMFEIFSAIALGLGALWILLYLFGGIKTLYVKHFLPLFYNKQELRRVQKRQLFADHIEGELKRLDTLEEWSDYKFAELEAEIEAEGRRKSRFPFPRRRDDLRREKSLSKALKNSAEKIIHLEGDPGGGKSVALRHLAMLLVREATKSRRTNSLIPIYVNLKELHREESAAIDRTLVESFIRAQINRVNNRDVDEFLDEEFSAGLQEGSWIFLFDSFDELPEVLSASQTTESITAYATAIADFLGSFNRCHGIVASREFKGPRQMGWPRFHIKPLSEKRQRQLVRRASLKLEKENLLLGMLDTAPVDLREMINIPMFLGLVCNHVRDDQDFPENAHALLESYVGHRLTRDTARLQFKFQMTPERAREVAEWVAFAMATEDGLGLSPERKTLLAALARIAPGMISDSARALNALEYIKLARADTVVAACAESKFTFAHRRFQEYFAACIVLADQTTVDAATLITDARWREAAVIICQTQSLEDIADLLTAAESALQRMVDKAEKLESEAKAGDDEMTRPFEWPDSALHLLDLLQEGFRKRIDLLPTHIRVLAGKLVQIGSSRGTTPDKKWALEVAGIVPDDLLLQLLRDAVSSGSQWLADTAYRQLSHLRAIPADLGQWIRRTLVKLAASGRLPKERSATDAHLRRLSPSRPYLDSMRLLLWIPTIDSILLLGIFLHIFCLYTIRPAWDVENLADKMLKSLVASEDEERRALSKIAFPPPEPNFAEIYRDRLKSHSPDDLAKTIHDEIVAARAWLGASEILKDQSFGLQPRLRFTDKLDFARHHLQALPAMAGLGFQLPELPLPRTALGSEAAEEARSHYNSDWRPDWSPIEMLFDGRTFIEFSSQTQVGNQSNDLPLPALHWREADLPELGFPTTAMSASDLFDKRESWLKSRLAKVRNNPFAAFPILSESIFFLALLIVLFGVLAIHGKLGGFWNEKGEALWSVLYKRMLVFFAASLFLFYLFPDSVFLFHPPGVILLYLLLLCWSPFAELCANLGYFTRPLWWPLYPVVAPFGALVTLVTSLVAPIWRRLCATLPGLRKLARKPGEVVVGLGVALVAGSLGWIGISVWNGNPWIRSFVGKCSSWIKSLRWKDNPPIGPHMLITDIVEWVILFFFFLCAIMFVCEMVLVLKDWIRLRRIVRRSMAGLETMDFITELGRYRSKAVRIDYARVVRERAILQADQAAEELLYALILALESDSQALQETKDTSATLLQEEVFLSANLWLTELLGGSRRHPNRFRHAWKGGSLDAFGAWYDAYTKRKGFAVGTWGKEMVDVLAETLDQVKLRAKADRLM